MITSIANFFAEGGIWMWPILMAQIVSMALIAERIYALYIQRSISARRMVQMFEEDIKRGQVDKVMARAQNMSNKPLATLAKIGAQTSMDFSGREELQLKMDEVLIEEAGRVENRVGYLAVLANVAPLLGLLGTIVGLIRCFGSIANVNAAEKAKILAAGVAEAMNATAYGLVVAVPALVAFAILQSRSNSLVEDLNKAALRMYIWLGFNVENLPLKKTPRASR
jgi:biopolymer transport protein ExbB/TolQ